MISTVIQRLRRDPKKRKEFEAAMRYAQVTDLEETSFFLKMLDSLGLTIEETRNYVKGLESLKK